MLLVLFNSLFDDLSLDCLSIPVDEFLNVTKDLNTDIPIMSEATPVTTMNKLHVLSLICGSFYFKTLVYSEIIQFKD